MYFVCCFDREKELFIDLRQKFANLIEQRRRDPQKASILRSYRGGCSCCLKSNPLLLYDEKIRKGTS